jgi:hypothetical protein
MILTGSAEWKEAPLEQLELISRNYLGLMRRSIDN